MLSTAQPNGQYINFQGMVTAIKSTSAPAQTGGVKQEVTVWDGQESKDVTFWADPPKGKMPLTGQDINIEKSYSLRGKQDGPKTYWNLYLSSYPLEIIGIPAPQQGFHPQGGNPAHAAPINAAMAANNMQYQKPTPPPPPVNPWNPPPQQSKEPDWDEIARGKVRCNLICSILSNSAIDSTIPAMVKSTAQEYMAYIFTGSMAEAEPNLQDQIPFGD